MGSHYIPVGKIKIDKEILDIVCPAAGYGETPPDPAIYCPANGYYLEEEPFEVPISTPTPSEEQIILLCDDLYQSVLSVYMTVNSGLKKIEVFDENMNLIFSTTFSASSYQYIFPTKNEGNFYIVRLSPNTEGSFITRYYTYSFTGYETNYRILQAKFNTPNIQNLSTAFRYQEFLMECLFLSNMDSCTNLVQAFQYSGIKSIGWPNSMSSLTTMREILGYTTNFRVFDISEINLPALTELKSALSYSKALIANINTSLPELTTLDSFASYSDLQSIEFPLPVNCPKIKILSSLLNNAKNFTGKLTIPAFGTLTTIQYMAAYSSVNEIKFMGAEDNISNFDQFASNCLNLTKVTWPTSLDSTIGSGTSRPHQNARKLRQVVLPLSMAGLNAGTGIFDAISTNYALEDVSTCNNWGSSQQSIDLSATANLKTFWQPNLKCSLLKVGKVNNNCPITEIEINWANSDFSASSVAIIIHGSLGSAEIDRIFTALPLMSKTITVNSNPGFAGCDPSIAQAKGWTVTGA